jgi:superkiller protein 3
MHQRATRFWIGIFALLTCLGSADAQQKAGPAKAQSPLATASADLQKNNLDGAEKAVWAVLSADPSNQDALTMLGVIRGRQQRFAEAEALFRRVLQLNPQSASASRDLANSLMAQDKKTDALNEYKHAIELAPQDMELRLEVAQLELANGEFEGALAILDGIPAQKMPAAAVPMRAASLLGVGRKADAEALIPQAKTSPKTAVELAQVFVEAGDGGAALECLSSVKAVNKSDAARLAYLRGRAFRQKGDNAQAVTSFRQALAEEPKSTPAMLALAEVYALENKHAESFKLLEDAQKLEPQSAEVLRPLVVEGMRAGQNDKAMQAATALEKVSTVPEDRYLVASVLIQQKQYVPASHLLEDYVAQRPQDGKGFLGLGMAYLNLLRYDDARRALERSVQLDPNLAEAEYQLGLLEGQQGNRKAAQQHWERAVELKPNHALALFSLGTLYLESGDLPAARSAFERSLAADPSNMKAEYNLALVLNKLGETEQAKAHFERYRKMQEAEHQDSQNSMRSSPM